jgi:leader peptidase (prepilin peptidase)/N-methyltransferase
MEVSGEAGFAELLRWPPFGGVLAGLWGLLWGSFGNVCIHRVPRGLSVVRPASHCPACQQPVAWFDNIPVLSFLALRGRCRRCRAPIAWRYPLFELLAALLAVAVYYRFVLGEPGPLPLTLARFLVYFFFAGLLAVLAMIDLEHQLLPDRITYPAIPALFVAGRVLGEVSFGEAALGAVAGYVLLRAVSDGYYYLTGREGLGYGDAKLLSAVGALLGWRAIPLTLLVGSCFGSIVSVPILLWQRRRTAAEPGAPEAPSLAKTAVPFGPFLAVGALFYLGWLHGRDLDSVVLGALRGLGVEIR